mmetsp:Transcript_14843/g.40689  ORF Transcript_14843/g.40689 Transcript_14843/m.40689 type:complete len:140 (+) Transcript_14843:105-524(+)
MARFAAMLLVATTSMAKAFSFDVKPAHGADSTGEAAYAEPLADGPVSSEDEVDDGASAGVWHFAANGFDPHRDVSPAGRYTTVHRKLPSKEWHPDCQSECAAKAVQHGSSMKEVVACVNHCSHHYKAMEAGAAGRREDL